ncbi:response regulator [Candidatus Magnetominusculus xianensis]|uniref:Response regulator receiver protein n=1 Tax=Candidatus Magnetominusculus xianensis TaxID=1748249 RepID=A0ABR5SB35_9BACT|nr:response regulator [Candidatus Magnetominusculus xianensis]KWT75610.1 response regulator receiver protein [Candidatus Magnetominusculus xianensis]MBF0403693.1 response regulator [Nitrospirota bacterium]
MMDVSVLKTLTVLYVEDDDYIRTMVARFLKRRVAKVYEAVNGREGLDIYISNKADIVITDIQMPVMSGMKMIEEIHKIDGNQPIIITTGYNDEHHTSGKVCRNIIKPIDNDELVESIISCLRRKTEAET